METNELWEIIKGTSKWKKWLTWEWELEGPYKKKKVAMEIRQVHSVVRFGQKGEGVLSFHYKEWEVFVALLSQPHAVSSCLRCMKIYVEYSNPTFRQVSMH